MGDYTDLTVGWNTITIPKSQLYGDAGSGGMIGGLQIVLYSTNPPVAGADQGTQTIVYLGGISYC